MTSMRHVLLDDEVESVSADGSGLWTAQPVVPRHAVVDPVPLEVAASRGSIFLPVLASTALMALFGASIFIPSMAEPDEVVADPAPVTSTAPLTRNVTDISRSVSRPSATAAPSTAAPVAKATAAPATFTVKPVATATPSPTAAKSAQTKKAATAKTKAVVTAKSTEKQVTSRTATTSSVGQDTSGSSLAPCAAGSAIERGLRPQADRVYRSVCAAFPEIRSYGGYRPGDPQYHGRGLAIDVMVSGEHGWAVANWARANASRLGIVEVIYSQKIWAAYRPGDGWRQMSNRGSATANHYDHVHLSIRG